MKKQILLAAIISIVAISKVAAQKSRSFNSSNYQTALGIKVFPPSGGAAVTLKHFIKDDAALEALGHFWDRGGRLTGLYEFHWDITGAPGLKWYVGPGAHIGFYKNGHTVTNEDIKEEGSYAAVGIDGIIGLDYKFNNIPLNLSVDWQPTIDFGNGRYNGFGGEFVGIAARYTF